MQRNSILSSLILLWLSLACLTVPAQTKSAIEAKQQNKKLVKKHSVIMFFVLTIPIFSAVELIVNNRLELMIGGATRH